MKNLRVLVQIKDPLKLSKSSFSSTDIKNCLSNPKVQEILKSMDDDAMSVTDGCKKIYCLGYKIIAHLIMIWLKPCVCMSVDTSYDKPLLGIKLYDSPMQLQFETTDFEKFYPIYAAESLYPLDLTKERELKICHLRIKPQEAVDMIEKLYTYIQCMEVKDDKQNIYFNT